MEPACFLKRERNNKVVLGRLLKCCFMKHNAISFYSYYNVVLNKSHFKWICLDSAVFCAVNKHQKITKHLVFLTKKQRLPLGRIFLQNHFVKELCATINEETEDKSFESFKVGYSFRRHSCGSLGNNRLVAMVEKMANKTTRHFCHCFICLLIV